MVWQTGRPEKGETVRIYIAQPNQLPEGVPMTKVNELPDERDKLGRFTKGSKTSQAKGGLTRRKTVKLGRRLGLGDAALVNPDFAPYKNAAIAYKKSYVRYLSETVGGGICSAAPASIVATAAWQLAASRYMFDKLAETGNMALAVTASKLGNDSKHSLMAAFEICAREAKARAEAGEVDSIYNDQLEFQKNLAKKKKAKIKEPEFVVESSGEDVEDPE